MKKIITLLLVGILATSFVACDDKNTDSKDTNKEKTTTSAKATEKDKTGDNSTETTKSDTATTTEKDEEKPASGVNVDELLAMPESPADFYNYEEVDGEIHLKKGAKCDENGYSIIPAEIDGKPVTQINRAFWANGNLKAVVVPETVVLVENEAFSSLSVETVIFKGNGLKTVGEKGFSVAEDLTYVEIPDSVTEIGQSAFMGSGLKEFKFPKNLKTIGISAFFSTKLENVVLPEGLETIDSSAFSSCTNLKTVRIPEGVTTIGSTAFARCDNLETLYIPVSVTSIGSDLLELINGESKATIVTPAGSYAETYAKENNYNYRNE